MAGSGTGKFLLTCTKIAASLFIPAVLLSVWALSGKGQATEVTWTQVYVPKGAEERKMQRALLQYWMPENREYVIKALMRAGRRDLIGSGPKCLVRR